MSVITRKQFYTFKNSVDYKVCASVNLGPTMKLSDLIDTTSFLFEVVEDNSNAMDDIAKEERRRIKRESKGESK